MTAATSFIPYRERAPDTTDLRALKAEHERCREEFGRRSSEAAESWARWCQAAARQGQPLDGLRRYTANEAERFFAQTIHGPDGHTYWDGTKAGFRRNDGSRRQPRLWWWERQNPPLGSGDSVVPTCGERNCITPEHCEKQDRRMRHLVYTDDQMIGRMQVVAMRLGRAPTVKEWEREKHRPTTIIYQTRFGSWTHALQAAGLEQHRKPLSPALAIRALQEAHKQLGRWPGVRDIRALAPHLKPLGLPCSPAAITRRLGPWAEALRKAGKR